VAASPPRKPRQSPLQNAATQKLLELAHDESGQAVLFFSLAAELRPVFLDDLIQDALLGPPAGIAVCTRN
jgi:hypothetical protein